MVVGIVRRSDVQRLVGFLLGRLHEDDVQGVVAERAVESQLVLDEPVEIEARRSVAFGIGAGVVIGFAEQRQLRRTILVVDRSVERSADRSLERQTRQDVVAQKSTTRHRHAVDDLRLERRKCHGVQHLVMLVVRADSPVAVALEIERAVLVVDRPDRARGQRRLHDAARAVGSRGVHLIRFRVRGRKIHAVFEILVLAVEIQTE